MYKTYNSNFNQNSGIVMLFVNIKHLINYINKVFNENYNYLQINLNCKETACEIVVLYRGYNNNNNFSDFKMNLTEILSTISVKKQHINNLTSNISDG